MPREVSLKTLKLLWTSTQITLLLWQNSLCMTFTFSVWRQGPLRKLQRTSKKLQKKQSAAKRGPIPTKWTIDQRHRYSWGTKGSLQIPNCLKQTVLLQTHRSQKLYISIHRQELSQIWSEPKKGGNDTKETKPLENKKFANILLTPVWCYILW